MIKSYTVTLDHKVVEKAKEKLKKKKLSPTMNELLKMLVEDKIKLSEDFE